MDAVRIRRQTPLFYGDGPDPEIDRPPHVRAASGIAWAATASGPRLCLCQDDAHFLALVDPETGRVDSLPLPAGPRSRRQFDTGRANKRDKFDLESACVVPTGAGERLWLVGSGSLPVREILVEIDLIGGGRVRVESTASLCARLREHEALRGAELNLEGACVAGAELVLLQRGNGVGGRNALIRVALAELQSFFAGATRTLDSLRIDLFPLPEFEGVALTFTDACVLDPGRLLFLAAAEASANAIDDGRVHASALGVLTLAPRPTIDRLLPIVERDGRPSRRKAEGICRDPNRAMATYLVVDADDPTIASELLEVELPTEMV